MSHTTAVDSIVFTDIHALEGALGDLRASGVRCSLVKDATPRAFYENQQGMGKADYVVRLDDARYDVGLYYDKDKKGYVARTDLWGGSVQKVLGVRVQPGEHPHQAALGKLYQHYGVQAATRAAVKQGYTVRKIVKEDGTIALQMTGMKGA